MNAILSLIGSPPLQSYDQRISAKSKLRMNLAYKAVREKKPPRMGPCYGHANLWIRSFWLMPRVASWLKNIADYESKHRFRVKVHPAGVKPRSSSARHNRIRFFWMKNLSNTFVLRSWIVDNIVFSASWVRWNKSLTLCCGLTRLAEQWRPEVSYRFKDSW